MSWFRKRRLSTSPVMIAVTLHQMAAENDRQIAPEALHLPRAVHARFRGKVFLYQEANILLALMDRVSPWRKDREPLFEPVFWQYRRIIFDELPRTFGETSSETPTSAARRQSVTAALRDLNAHMHPPMGNRYEIARSWSHNWLADIGHNEMNPTILARFSSLWSNKYTVVQRALQAMVVK
jgi:hypothetical protein